MLEKLKNKHFEYKKLTEEEQKSRGILGRLIGPCADFINPTRNGRAYTEELWENVFENEFMQEKIANRCCFGELNHPENRTDVDLEKVAICLAEKPKKGADGKLYGVFDILSTPNGKILKALCDYGCKIGISSRGQGDVDEVNNTVDPNTYECECFDAVLMPGVEAARLKYVTEDYKGNKNVNLKTILSESLKTADEKERKIMMETIKKLKLNEAVEKEIKITDCEAITTAAQALEIAKKAKAKWAFGLDDSLGINVGEKFFEMFTKAMELFVYENGKDSICFGIKKDGSIYGPYDINNNIVNVSILATLNAETDLPEITEVTNTEEAPIKEALGESVEENDVLELPAIIDDSGENKISEPAEQAVEPEIDDEQIFLDFLANNFSEDKVRKVCKVLDIEIEGDDGSNAEEIPAEDIKDVDKEEVNKAEENVEEATDGGVETLVHSLKEALKNKSDLENIMKSLQEKLAVSDAKADELVEECSKYKEAVVRLSVLAKSAKDLKARTTELEESLKQKTAVIQTQKERIARLAESNSVNVEHSKLKEDFNAKMTETNSLKEALASKQAEYDSLITTLNNQLTESNKQSDTKINTLTENITKITRIKESYRTLAHKAVNKYIEVKSETLGLTPADIKRKLGESYTIEDVDQVCEDLKQYQLNVSRLPFSVDRKVGVRVNESKSKSAVNIGSPKLFTDDDVDDQLIRLANVK